MAYCLTLLLFTLTATQAWILRINVDHIEPQKTKNVLLVCEQVDIERNLKVKKINGIRITKIDSFGVKSTFSEMHVLSPEVWCRDKAVNVDASLNQRTGAFLKVTWPIANDKTEGAYGCEISGYNALDNHISIHVNPSVKINRKTLTENDVISHIQKVTQSHVRKQHELELEIITLKKYIKENLQSLRQQINKIDDEMKTKLASLQNTIESTCSTKTELKEQVSKLKGFAKDQIQTVEDGNQNELDKFSSHIQNTFSDCKEQFSEIARNMSILKVHFTSSADSLSKKDRDISSNLSSTTNILTRQIRSVDTKYRSTIKNVNLDIKNKISDLEQKCPCTTPAPTTPKPTPNPMIVSDWPGGSYALVRPATGCANLDALHATGRSLFKTNSYDDNSVSKTKEFKIILETGSKKRKLKFCEKDTSIPSLSSPSWPKGTYCIGIKGGLLGNCARGFTYGYLSYFLKKESTLQGLYKTGYCCRDDQKADIPIKLPTATPFNLYRYNSKCKQVEGMSVRAHKLQVNTHNTLTLREHGKHADIGEKKSEVQLCFYKPT